MKSTEPEPILRDSEVWKFVGLLVAGLTLGGALLWLIGCGPLPAPNPPTPPPGSAVFCAAPSVHSGTNDGTPIANATATINGRTGLTNADGYIYLAPVEAGPQLLVVSAEGFEVYSGVYQIDSWSCDLPIALQPTHVDPSTIPLAELAQIRGAMWPRANVCADPPLLPYGPRPGRPDNIIGTPYFDAYTPEQQQAIIRCLRSVGYTHVVVGGLIDTWAYHGQFVRHDYSTPEGFERFLDLLQTFWDGGLAPIVFVHVDGAGFAETEAMVTPLFASARAQRLIRIVVMPGWEPTRYDWSSVTWAKYVGLARRLLPNALNLIHTVTDVDAPVGTDSLFDDDDKQQNPGGNGAGWARVAPFIHGWLIQNGPYETGPAVAPHAVEFAAQFKPEGDGATFHGAAWHFAHGIAGWPTESAWGDGIPICLYAAEQTAYPADWANRPSEPERLAWGDLAIASGACGYLDGGTVDVPRRR